MIDSLYSTKGTLALGKRISKGETMVTCSKCQNLNLLSTKLLAQLGNNKPSQTQIELMESLIARAALEHQFTFSEQLTRRETKCLLLAAKGKTSSETAKLLGIKASTVDTYRRKIKQKLACSTMAQAVFEGMRFGYMQPKPAMVQ